ncbi:DUF885 domain-containing protein [Amphiplicatus metriothermophilus]|uniref:Uncharacterized conserved protein, DUF885 familyt n=1 Tax=Amphiplicatus metriothermophilus TaxID=1519374 RepID=A0A239PLE5_9PROT|nr:DUF885 domain-containing protein [Amphiplicatus metriothermophilus]MBB5517762.1 uncharacterized protein (DUF885 family) [Amphiplicatus metriothermophilus]SNT67904.1 Uncharacterized conserved protein, DUF885 familyt [Amphiplicatus metriothermophilus]
MLSGNSLAAGVAAMIFTVGAAVMAPAGAQESASEALQDILDDHWAWMLEENPVFATSLGVRDYDDRLPDASLEAYEASVEKAREFVARLDALDADALSAEERLNRDLLRLDLAQDVEAAQYGGKYLVISGRGGPHTFLANLPDRLPFLTKADYESYIARLRVAPAYVDQVKERLRAGVEAGWTQPCVIMEGYEKSIDFHVVDAAEESVLFKPFENRPQTIPERDWRRLKNEAARVIEREVVPAVAGFGDFYRQEYAPACRETVGLSDLPDGADYYAFRTRQFTTTALTPDAIHDIGLKEVARIRKEMEAVIAESGFEGSFEEFQEFLRSDPRFYAKSEAELLEKNAYVAKKADGEMPKLFTRFPRMPYTVKPVPEDIAEATTTAYYERPAGDGSRAGVYRVNTSKLDTRPLYEIEALTLHEAVPGHHFQIALAQELDLPEFRKYTFFTAFVEGWGLYAESLGLDIGFYQDPYSNFGRLSYEMWRACRLVVDTGLHAKGWSRDRAIAFMAENTALSEHNIRAEVDRYIGNGGQALAYKIGELKLKELRARAARALGPDFDLRRFHDAVLENGGVPLSVLEAKIDAWIAAEKAR